MSWEDTNPAEWGALEFCPACGYKLVGEEVGASLCEGCALDTCPRCIEYLEDCECEPNRGRQGESGRAAKELPQTEEAT